MNEKGKGRRATLFAQNEKDGRRVERRRQNTSTERSLEEEVFGALKVLGFFISFFFQCVFLFFSF